MKKITDYLKDLGLTEIEAEVYQGLLEAGPTTVKDLADHINIKRITTHFNVESLVSKGLVVQTMHGTRRQILAESPERLRYLIEQKLDKAKNLQNKFPDFLNTIHAITPQSYKGKEFEIQYYEGHQGVMHIYEEALKAKEFRAYVNWEKLAEVFPHNLELFLETHIKRADMHVWEIMEDSVASREYIKKMPQKRYYYKLIPKDMNLSIIDYMIFDGKVAIVELEKKAKGTLILNEHLYNNAKVLHIFIWEMLGKNVQA